MQTKNLLTVAGLLNVACPFQFGHGVTVVNRVGQVGSRKLSALRKESGMRRNRLHVFLVRWFRWWRQSEREIDQAYILHCCGRLWFRFRIINVTELCWCELLKVEDGSAALEMNFTTPDAWLKWECVRIFFDSRSANVILLLIRYTVYL